MACAHLVGDLGRSAGAGRPAAPAWRARRRSVSVIVMVSSPSGRWPAVAQLVDGPEPPAAQRQGVDQQGGERARRAAAARDRRRGRRSSEQRTAAGTAASERHAAAPGRSRPTSTLRRDAGRWRRAAAPRARPRRRGSSRRRRGRRRGRRRYIAGHHGDQPADLDQQHLGGGSRGHQEGGEEVEHDAQAAEDRRARPGHWPPRPAARRRGAATTGIRERGQDAGRPAPPRRHAGRRSAPG